MYYANPANGDLHVVVPGKLVAFRGSRKDTDENSSFRPEAYLEVFKELGVHSIVRLNEPEYQRAGTTICVLILDTAYVSRNLCSY
jgi:hypothetical protein